MEKYSPCEPTVSHVFLNLFARVIGNQIVSPRFVGSSRLQVDTNSKRDEIISGSIPKFSELGSICHVPSAVVSNLIQWGTVFVYLLHLELPVSPES